MIKLVEKLSVKKLMLRNENVIIMAVNLLISSGMKITGIK